MTLPSEQQIQIRVTPAEKIGFKRAAMHAGLTLSAWVRSLCRVEAMNVLRAAGEAAEFAGVPREKARKHSAPTTIYSEIPPATARHIEQMKRENDVDAEILAMRIAKRFLEGVGPSDTASRELHKINDAVQERYQRTMPEAFKGPSVGEVAPPFADEE